MCDYRCDDGPPRATVGESLGDCLGRSSCCDRDCNWCSSVPALRIRIARSIRFRDRDGACWTVCVDRFGFSGIVRGG